MNFTHLANGTLFFSLNVKHTLSAKRAKRKILSATILISLADFAGSGFSPINNITAANDRSYFRSLIPRCAHPAGIFSGGTIRPGSANLWEYSRRCVPTRRLFSPRASTQRKGKFTRFSSSQIR